MTCFQPEPKADDGPRLQAERQAALGEALNRNLAQLVQAEAALAEATAMGAPPEELAAFVMELGLADLRSRQEILDREVSAFLSLLPVERDQRAYEQAARRWLKTHPVAGALLQSVEQDAVFQILQPPLPFDAQVEANMVMVGQVSDLDSVRQAAGSREAYDLFLQTAYLDWLLQQPRLSLFEEAGVLLPVRIETIFKPNAQGGERMYLRLIPDEASIDRHNPFVSQGELNALTEMWQAAFDSLPDPNSPPHFWLTDRAAPASQEALRTAWNQLCSRVGPRRAAYLAETYKPEALDGRVSVAVPEADRETPERRFCNRVSGFPEQVEVWIKYCDPEQPDVCELVHSATLTVATDKLVFDLPQDGDESDRWWVSWEKARDEVGLGVEIDLPRSKEHIQAIYVAGIGQDDPADHFRLQAQSGELGLLALGDATNTVHGAPAADLGNDPEAWRRAAATELERRAGEMRFALIDTVGLYLTGQQGALPVVPAPQQDSWEWSSLMVKALWPALWGHFLRDVWELGEDAMLVGWWATRYLLPEGALPPLRISDQPYGLLPVSAFRRWRVTNVQAEASGLEERMLPGLLDSRAAMAKAARKNAVEANAERLLDVLGQDGLPAQFIYRLCYPLELIREAYRGRPDLDPALADQVDQYIRDQFSMAEGRTGTSPSRHYAAQGETAAVGLPLIVPRRMTKAGEDQDGNPRWMMFIEAVERILGTLVWTDLKDLFRDFDQEAFSTLPDSLLLRLMIHSRWLAAAWAGQAQNGAVSPLHPELFNFNFNQATVLETAGETFDPALEIPELEQVIYGRMEESFFHVGKAVEEALVYTRFGPEVRDDPFSKRRIANLERSFKATLDAAGRVDPWFTGLAYRRLDLLRALTNPRFRLGVYGWVEGPVLGEPGPRQGGMLLAPSHAQALTGVVLRDRYLTAKLEGDPETWHMNVDSLRVRTAMEIAEEVRLGAHPWEALGRRVERIAATRDNVKKLRDDFPLRLAQPGANTPCNGWEALLFLCGAPEALNLTPEQAAAVLELRLAMDTWADLLVAEGVHGVVTERAAAGAAMDAAAGFGSPPTLGFTRTPQPGLTRSSRVLVGLPFRESAPAGAGPCGLADPSTAAYLAVSLGGPEDWDWTAGGASASLADLGLQPEDTLVLSKDQLEALARAALRAAPEAELEGSGTARQRLARQFVQAAGRGPASPLELDWLGTPDAINLEQQAAAELAGRYQGLRQAAEAHIAALQAAPAADVLVMRRLLRETLRWGITPEVETTLAQALYGALPAEDDGLAALQVQLGELLVRAADTLQARLAAAPEAAAAPPPAAGKIQQEPALARLARAVAELAAPEGQIAVLSSVRTEDLSFLTGLQMIVETTGAERDWLSTTAAVRPILANLEALQLEAEYASQALPLPARPGAAYRVHFGGLQPWSSKPGEPWGEELVAALPEDAAQQERRLPPLTMVYAPPGGLPAHLALGWIDRWSEVIPRSQRSVTAAFEFNAPAARAQQAILLAVPPELGKPLTNTLLVEMLEETHELVRARAARPEDLGLESTLAPATLLQAAGRTGMRLDDGVKWK